MIFRNISLYLGVLVAFILYVVVGPAVSIGSIQPNFVFAFCACLTIVRPTNGSVVASFVLGLLAGLSFPGPLILTAMVVVIVATLLSGIFSVLDNDSSFMQIVALFASMLLCEFLYAFFLTLGGAGVSFLGLVWYRVLPCALYDVVAAALLFPLVSRFIGPGAQRTQIPLAQFH